MSNGNLIIITIIVIFPVISFIVRKISPSLSSNYWSYLDNYSFYGTSIFIPKNTSINNNSILIQDYKNIRLYIQTKLNKMNLYFTLLNSEYYDEERFDFSISLNTNKSQIIYDNKSVIYKHNFDTEYFTKFRYTKHIYRNLFEQKLYYILKSISVNYTKSGNDTFFGCELFFIDFDLKINLKQEKYTYRVFYLIECFCDMVIYTLTATTIYPHNTQNISILFLLNVRAILILSGIYIFFDLSKIGIPLFKLLLCYFHLVIYGEFLLSIIDILSIVLILFYLFFICCLIFSTVNNDSNYFYCFHNKIENGKIVKKNIKLNLINKIILSSVIFFIISYLDYSASIHKNFIPLYFSLFIAIMKYLTQREALYQTEKEYLLLLYSFETITYLYHLLKVNLGKFYRIKPRFHYEYFIMSIILYIILLIVITYDLRIKYFLREDFKKIKDKENDCCSICLRDFKSDKHNNIIFCTITDEDNIHKTGCNHYFHEKCLFNWRKYKNICPICKKELDTPEYFYCFDENPLFYYIEF
jgi:hypothetical protein